MRFQVAISEQHGCHVSLHASDVPRLFSGAGTARHFCRALRVDQVNDGGQKGRRCFVGFTGDKALEAGTLGIAGPLAACLGLEDGSSVDVRESPEAAVATSVMVQPATSDDWEVVETEAGFIEENLLSQIAVLSPGMVFPVWVHGHMPIKMRVDTRDDNKSDCFLLAQDTEIMVESKQRKLFDTDNAELHRDQGLWFRVRLVDHDIDGPTGRVHVDDLERLAGYAPRDGCLVWLTSRIFQVGRTDLQETVDLVRIVGDASVPRRQIVLGSLLTDSAGIPCFSRVKLERCREVPVHLSELKLTMVGEEAEKSNKVTAEHIDLLFKQYVEMAGDVDVIDGTVVRLHSNDASVCQSGLDASENGVNDVTNVLETAGKNSYGNCSGGSDGTDLYEGLSDIDDIYSNAANKCELIGVADGVFELDLGLDRPRAEATTAVVRNGSAKNVIHPCVVTVRIGFALPGGQEAVSGVSGRPPFVRLTRRCLDSSVRARFEPFKEDRICPVASPKFDPLRVLWQCTPGLGAFPEDENRGAESIATSAVSIVPFEVSTVTSEKLEFPMFTDPAADLRESILAQVGCVSQNRGIDSRPSACEPNIPACVAPGAAAVIGPPGCGKTCLCESTLAELARDEGVLSLRVSCSKLGKPSRKFQAIQERLYDVFRLACWHAPSAMLLDDFDSLCPDVEPGAPNLSMAEERSPMLCELLVDLMSAVRGAGGRVAVCVTLAGEGAAHRSLWRPLGLEHKMVLRPPLLKERPEILQALCRKKNDDGWQVDAALLRDGALDSWSGTVDGFSLADLVNLTARACIEAETEVGLGVLTAASRSKDERAETSGATPLLSLRHLERARDNFVPSSMSSKTFLVSNVKMEDVGGLATVKKEMLDMLTMPTKYSVLVDRSPVRACKGFMLVGPPGCGKTMLVQAIANETKGLLRFLTVKGPELLSKYIGESEAGVRRIFESAAAAAPSVIFFDEIEALAPRRGADSTGVTDRVVNQMLCYLDGVEDRGRVFVIAATGRPDLVDAALLRPGRFDRICYCGIPTAEERLDICTKLSAKCGLELEPGLAGQNVQRSFVAKLPRLFSSADISGLFASARVEAINEALGKGTGAPRLTFGHLDAALRTAKPSISEADERNHEKIFRQYRPSEKVSALRRTEPEASAGRRVALA